MADSTVSFDVGKAGPPFIEQAGISGELEAYPNVSHSITAEELLHLESWIKTRLKSSPRPSSPTYLINIVFMLSEQTDHSPFLDHVLQALLWLCISYPTILFSLHPIYVHKIPIALHQQRTRPVPMAVNLLVLFFLLLFVGFAAGRIPAIIVFGDSTVDPGNNDFLLTPLKANFPPYGCDFPGSTPTGRFCNGRLTTDLISASLGLLPAVPPYLDPSLPIQRLASGVSFASAGTGLDPATSQLLSVIPLMEEVELFREYKSRLAAHFGVAEAEAIVGEALYLVSIGTNDYIVNYFPMATGRSKEFTVGEFGEFLTAGAAEFVAALHALGARKIVFVGLAPIGCLPLERLTGGGGGCSEEHSAAARGFNDRLEAALARLDGELPGLRLRFAPLYDFVANVIQNAQSYGFKNTEQGCCGTGELEVSFLCNKWSPYTCPDANQYAFFDAVHPSEKLNSLLTDYLLNTTLAEFI